MEKDGRFVNYDDEDYYRKSQEFVKDPSTSNFVVEFGRTKAKIAFDLDVRQFGALISEERPDNRHARPASENASSDDENATPEHKNETPIRNIWGPDGGVDRGIRYDRLKNEGVADLLGKHYGFSARLRAIIKTPPNFDVEKATTKKPNRIKQKLHIDKLGDEEKGDVSRTSLDYAATKEPVKELPKLSHYSIVNQMVNYHAVDSGDKFICVGANWMHRRRSKKSAANILEDEGRQRRLYSWLIICDDNTVISFHEDSGMTNSEDLLSLRANTISVLSQVSILNQDSFNPISLQTVRAALDQENDTHHGHEGASNLFYYLFDDWHAAYETVAGFQTTLGNLRTYILQNASKRSVDTIEIDVIPRLHVLGSRIREMDHVYEGYKNIIQRILEPPKIDNSRTLSANSESQWSRGKGRQGPAIATSAISRFERLGDRLQLLILSETKEFMAEKDALTNTYFNINAQKDSEATASLTRAAGLLAKLSVLFLPVSLMTSYFSIQIKDLEGVYTREDYWYSFAVIMSLSFLGVFFCGRLLMYISESFDKYVSKRFNTRLAGAWARLRGRSREKES
ncbi:hypothetical protein GLAREA_05671 [Glarea lozoyensis ATCC 20868]|uniref:Magnesium transport protein CorA, transmembrane region n=1 Tax=Glarea lozoyensis (strain ATCC 20868 / MF5171) TaxID=1116229 RepID=S3EDI2_GLAL2|nr:uncharacterized protein GLAREA_05671 [Glarea lozoyensis ATCC 20868]EPE36333.1 hypothetical protein GLAREA_05671 [Glarea lozoyensis ATCC 20868]